jgi:hypothetical protein
VKAKEEGSRSTAFITKLSNISFMTVPRNWQFVLLVKTEGWVFTEVGQNSDTNIKMTEGRSQV